MNRTCDTHEGDTYRVLIGKKEERKNLQDLETDGSQSNSSDRSRIGGKLAGFIWFRMLTNIKVL